MFSHTNAAKLAGTLFSINCSSKEMFPDWNRAEAKKKKILKIENKNAIKARLQNQKSKPTYKTHKEQ